MIMHIALVVLNRDNTLTPSESPVPAAVLPQLIALPERRPTCIISVGQCRQFRSQIHVLLPVSAAPLLGRLHLVPTCRTRCWSFDADDWVRRCAEDLSETKRFEGLTTVKDEARWLGLWESHTLKGTLKNRRSLIAFPALSQGAHVEAKQARGADGCKRDALQVAIPKRLPDLLVQSGDSTSVDIAHWGTDNAYCTHKFTEITGIGPESMLCMGDRLDEGANCSRVITVGVRTHEFDRWDEMVDTVAALSPPSPTSVTRTP